MMVHVAIEFIGNVSGRIVWMVRGCLWRGCGEWGRGLKGNDDHVAIERGMVE